MIDKVLDEYQTQARTTAVYPDQYKVAYPALGLVEEAREFMDACYPAGAGIVGPDAEAVLKEAGDVFWYCASLAGDLNTNLSECFSYPSQPIMSPGEFLGKVSELAGHCKKICRGDDNRNAKIVLVGAIISTIMEYVNQYIPGDEDEAYSLVCDTNLDKLFDRKERGVLKGCGDNR